MNTDPIADYLTRIRNASSAGLKLVQIPSSNLKKSMTQILFDQGYISNYKVEEDGKQGIIKIALKYNTTTRTSKGVITDKEARKLNVGGEVLCYVY
jgi:small subunit ribosomal protein S8